MVTHPTPPASKARWKGGALMGIGWASFAGSVGDNREHAHHALQLVVAEAGEINLFVRELGEIVAPGVLLNADVAHRLHPGPARLLYLDRETSAGRLLANKVMATARVLSVAERTAILEAWPEPTRPNLTLVLAALGLCALAEPSAFPGDDRVRQVLDSLLTRPDWDGSLTTLAAEAALSPSRFRHRVRDLVGMPLRPYLRWLRLRRALELAANHVGLTQAAQDAGFSDAAHLTRTMQRHFGVAPSAVVDALRQRGLAD